MCNDNAVPLALPRKAISILVVEDSFALRFTLAEWLRSQNYTVCEAASADEAKTLLESPFIIDLVITDVEMPGSMDGLGLFDYIKQKSPHLEVVVVSGNDKYKGLKDQGVTFFRKPYDLRLISSHVENIIKNQKPSE